MKKVLKTEFDILIFQQCFQFAKPQGTVLPRHVSYCNRAHLLTGWHQHRFHGHSAAAPVVHQKSGTLLQQMKFKPFIRKPISQQLCKMVDGKVQW